MKDHPKHKSHMVGAADFICALASAREIRDLGKPYFRTDGAEEGFDPARQVRFALENQRLHEGLESASLLEALLKALPTAITELQLSNTERAILAHALMASLRT